jgi:hypothetical protein
MIQLHYDTDVCEGLCEHDQIVCLAKSEMLLDEVAGQIAETFKILGDPTRIEILHALSRRELCVCDIAAIVANGAIGRIASTPSAAWGATGEIP